jgi:hypothetical protein
VDDALPHPGSHAPLPDADRAPDGFPIKAKRGSRLYHVPGSAFYGRTIADVWFATTADAEAAGFALPAAQRRAATNGQPAATPNPLPTPIAAPEEIMPDRPATSTSSPQPGERAAGPNGPAALLARARRTPVAVTAVSATGAAVIAALLISRGLRSRSARRQA